MNTSEVLNKAADLIEKRGWTTGNDGRDDITSESPLCLEGAIGAALGMMNGLNDPSFFEQVVLRQCPAAAAVHSYLDLNAHDPLWMWNDEWHPTSGVLLRTATEVIEVLRAAAVIEAAREDQDAAWATYAEVVTA